MPNQTVTKIKAHIKGTGRNESCVDYMRYFETIEDAKRFVSEFVSVTPVESITYDAATGAYLRHEVLA